MVKELLSLKAAGTYDTNRYWNCSFKWQEHLCHQVNEQVNVVTYQKWCRSQHNISNEGPFLKWFSVPARFQPGKPFVSCPCCNELQTTIYLWFTCTSNQPLNWFEILEMFLYCMNRFMLKRKELELETTSFDGCQTTALFIAYSCNNC